MNKFILFAIICFTLKLNSQNSAYLDANNVKALVFNRNDMFWDLFGSGNARYEVPKGSGKNCNFANSVWIGGLDAGAQLHMAGMTYRQNGVDFWPGPLDTITGSTSASVTSSFDKIWKLNSTDINNFIVAWTNGSVTANTYTPPVDILTWPANGNTASGYSQYLAPFVDVNSDGIYDPMGAGDYPKIKGDQMLFYVTNDKYSSHTETGAPALGVEMQVSAYAYNCANIINAYPELYNTTFYNYKIINRSSIQYNNTMVGIWCDADLGNYSDDYIGCDTINKIGYVYNGSPTDATTGGYGNYPPILSYQILKGPYADSNDGIDNDKDGLIDEPLEETKFNKFLYYNNNFGSFPPQTTNPSVAIHYYNYLTGYWKDGTQFTQGGTSYGGTTTASYVYPGNIMSNTGWTEGTAGNLSGDRRFIISNGPFTFKPNATTEIEFSILTTFDSTAGGYKNLTKVINQNNSINNFYTLASKPTCTALTLGLTENTSEKFSLQLNPNPTNDFINVNPNYNITGADVKVYNSLGQIVYSGKSEFPSLRLSVKDYSPGIYFIELKTKTNITTGKFIKN